MSINAPAAAPSQPLAREEEDALVDRAVAGDEDAFAALYAAYHARVRNHLLYRTGNPDLADDLAQQAFLQAWAAIHRYRRGRSPIMAWFMTIARNLIIDRQRSKKAPGGAPIPLEIDVADPDVGIDPAYRAELAIDADWLRGALARIKPLQRQVLTALYLEGHDYAHVARALGKSEGNARVIAHRGLCALRELARAEAAPIRQPALFEAVA